MLLPNHYLITPSFDDEARFLASLENSLKSGIKLVQLRAKNIDADVYESLAKKAIELTHAYSGKILLTGDASRAVRLSADGLHLDSKALSQYDSRPIVKGYLLSASSHTLEGLKKAESIGASFGLLSPVKFTKSHPDIEPFGWDGFGDIAKNLSIPVYAFGGVDANDEQAAIKAGGQGVAGNRGYWKE